MTWHARRAVVFLILLVGAGCDTTEDTIDDPLDVSGRWEGELMARTDAVLGGNIISFFETYEVDLRLTDEGSQIEGSGRLRNTCAGRTPTSCDEPLRLGGAWMAFDVGGSQLDSTVSLQLSFEAGAAFNTLGLNPKVSADGRTLEGSASGVGNTAFVRLAR